MAGITISRASGGSETKSFNVSDTISSGTNPYFVIDTTGYLPLTSPVNTDFNLYVSFNTSLYVPVEDRQESGYFGRDYYYVYNDEYTFNGSTTTARATIQNYLAVGSFTGISTSSYTTQPYAALGKLTFTTIQLLGIADISPISYTFSSWVEEVIMSAESLGASTWHDADRTIETLMYQESTARNMVAGAFSCPNNTTTSVGENWNKTYYKMTFYSGAQQGSLATTIITSCFATGSELTDITSIDLYHRHDLLITSTAPFLTSSLYYRISESYILSAVPFTPNDPIVTLTIANAIRTGVYTHLRTVTETKTSACVDVRTYTFTATSYLMNGAQTDYYSYTRQAVAYSQTNSQSNSTVLSVIETLTAEFGERPAFEQLVTNYLDVTDSEVINNTTIRYRQQIEAHTYSNSTTAQNIYMYGSMTDDYEENATLSVTGIMSTLQTSTASFEPPAPVISSISSSGYFVYKLLTRRIETQGSDIRESYNLTYDYGKYSNAESFTNRYYGFRELTIMTNTRIRAYDELSFTRFTKGTTIINGNIASIGSMSFNDYSWFAVFTNFPYYYSNEDVINSDITVSRIYSLSPNSTYYDDNGKMITLGDIYISDTYQNTDTFSNHNYMGQSYWNIITNSQSIDPELYYCKIFQSIYNNVTTSSGFNNMTVTGSSSFMTQIIYPDICYGNRNSVIMSGVPYYVSTSSGSLQAVDHITYNTNSGDSTYYLSIDTYYPNTTLINTTETFFSQSTDINGTSSTHITDIWTSTYENGYYKNIRESTRLYHTISTNNGYKIISETKFSYSVEISFATHD